MRKRDRNAVITTSRFAVVRDGWVMCALLLFVIFFMLKVNGYLDFTARYGIREFIASREIYNLQLILDNETTTVWGAQGNASDEDWLEIVFRSKRKIESVELQAEEGNCPLLELYRQDMRTGELILCECQREGNRFILAEPVEAERIRFQVCSGQRDVPWIVQELIL